MKSNFPTGPAAVAGIVWYKPKDWARLRSIFVDGSILQDTYAEWLREAKALEFKLRREGRAVRRVHLDLDAFQTWCTLQGLPTDAAARSQFAAEHVRLNNPR